MARFGWQIIASVALWFGIIFAGCYNNHNTSKSSVQTEQEQDSETDSHSKESAGGNQGISTKWESLQIELQPNSAELCPGECVDIAVRVFGGNPPYHFSWDRELSSATTRGPYEVCPDSDTKYTVTVRDTGLDSEEFVIPAERIEGSTSITVIDDCASSIPLDAGDVAKVEDASEHSDADIADVENASDDSTNDTGECTTDAPCAPNCPDLYWVTIEGGTFMMGSVEGIGDDDEHPQHEVTVRSFKMSKTEVTVAQYGICVDAGICSTPEFGAVYHNWGVSGRENHPVNGLDWYQAREFAEWLGARLPSESEWEYAARSGGQDIVYPWGNEDATCEHAIIVIVEDGSNQPCQGYITVEPCITMEVCSNPLGNTVQGLCDMAGNVWDWVEDDMHDNYNGAPSDGQAWIDSPRGFYRVLRGGSWGSFASDCRSASRARGNPVGHGLNVGFRVVLDSEAPQTW